jgi:hypothetical protein
VTNALAYHVNAEGTTMEVFIELALGYNDKREGAMWHWSVRWR